MHSNLQCPHSANTAYLDSEASRNYANKSTPLENVMPLKNALPVHLANGSKMMPTHCGVLPNLPTVSNSNKICQICQEQSGPSLLSVGKLCDDNCLTACDKHKCIAYKRKPILKALRCPTTGMHVTDLTNPLLQQNLAHSNLQQFTSLECLRFLHGALGFHPISTLRRAASAGYLRSFPDLTEKNLNKLSTPGITALGHLDANRKNLQSTKPKPEEDEWTLTLKTHISNKTHDFFHKIVDLKNAIHTDQTGKFRVRSTSGSNCIMITCSYDANAILARALRNRTGGELCAATSNMHDYLTARGYKPNHQMLDNEASTQMKKHLHKNNVKF